VCGVAQLLLDPHYRTLHGFRALVEKDFASFGHKFHDRCLSGTSESSPVFLQFMDCVWQLQRQFPRAFEFNEALTLAVAQAAYSAWFGNFLYNSERERDGCRVRGWAADLWSALAAAPARDGARRDPPARAVTPEASAAEASAAEAGAAEAGAAEDGAAEDGAVVRPAAAFAEPLRPAAEFRNVLYDPDLRDARPGRAVLLRPDASTRRLELFRAMHARVRVAEPKPRGPAGLSKETLLERLLLSIEAARPGTVSRHRTALRRACAWGFPSGVGTAGGAEQAPCGPAARGERAGSAPRAEGASPSDGSCGAPGGPASGAARGPGQNVVWERDDEATRCRACDQAFGVFRRKHHCRRCGKIFCDDCSSYRAPLRTRGEVEVVRMCRPCAAAADA
jgi:hypothetical protein